MQGLRALAHQLFTVHLDPFNMREKPRHPTDLLKIPPVVKPYRRYTDAFQAWNDVKKQSAKAPIRHTYFRDNFASGFTPGALQHDGFTPAARPPLDLSGAARPQPKLPVLNGAQLNRGAFRA